MKILVVEAEDTPRYVMQRFFQRAGYKVDTAPTVALAETCLAASRYSFVLLAQALPDGDGIAVLRRFLQHGDQTASFILLTATDNLDDRLRGFDAGADDCVVKSISLVELERRMRVISRQRFGRQRTQISFGPGFVLDLGARALRHGNDSVNLSRSQFDLLHYLLRHRGQPLTRQQLGAHIGREGDDSNFIDVHIMNVRKTLARYAPPDFLQTVRGIGYQAA